MSPGSQPPNFDPLASAAYHELACSRHGFDRVNLSQLCVMALGVNSRQCVSA